MLEQATPLNQTIRFAAPRQGSTDEPAAFDDGFQAFFLERCLPVARVTTMLGIGVTLALCILDWLVMPVEFAERALQLRVLMTLLPLSAALAASYYLKQTSFIPPIFAAAAVLVGISTILVGSLAARSGTPLIVWGVVIITFTVHLVLGLNFRQSMSVGWSIFVFFLGFSILTRADNITLAYGSVLLAAANAIGSIASYRIESFLREVYDARTELKHRARSDGLTGLYNRRAFDEHLRQVWKQARRDEKSVAIVIVDIDHFKLYNDCYGRARGDECIRTISHVLAGSVSRPLDLVARYGGEEFALVLYDPKPEFLRAFVRKLCYRVADEEVEHRASAVASSVTVSIGAAIAEVGGTLTVDNLIRRTDDALYEAKTLGRNQAVVYKTEWGRQTGAQRAHVLV